MTSGDKYPAPTNEPIAENSASAIEGAEIDSANIQNSSRFIEVEAIPGVYEVYDKESGELVDISWTEEA